LCAPAKATTPPRCDSALLVRRGAASDLDAISAIQAASPEAAQWPAADYLRYDLRVAASGGRVVGFLVTRTPAPGESEILNLAVAPVHRRQGVARTLIQTWMRGIAGDIFLEVRASNFAAQMFYKSLGFQEFDLRPEYYALPPETGIVMKFHSC
jgi:ribosomal-protein-alanine N-acetyltransferase